MIEDMSRAPCPCTTPGVTGDAVDKSPISQAQVVVCVATHRRPEGLRRLLAGLDGQRFEPDAELRVGVIVVDNDPGASAAEVCTQAANTLRWPLEYRMEPRRGISQARNTLVAAAMETGAEFIVFVDDDETPDPGWLEELLRVRREYDADVVSGPVLPHFYEAVPRWVVDGKFFEQPFERPRHPTGHRIEATGAGNVLLRTKIFAETGETFDERVGLIGGEDTLFFTQVQRAGYTMVWADEAPVHEWTPASRAGAKWLLRRAYRLGNNRSLLETRGLNPGLRARLFRFAKGAGRILQGLSLLPASAALCPIVGRSKLVESLQHVCRGAGMLAGLAGVLYEEYR